MNHTHRLVWNAARCAWQAVSETAAAHCKPGGLRRSCAALAALALVLTCAATASFAGPQGAEVTLGNASVVQAGGSTTITQSSAQLAIDWQSFSVGAGEVVRFVQPSAQSVALNRVLGTEPSAILGQLSANGQVFLLNPNGVLLGASARVDVGGLVASTLSLSNEDFAAGRFKLQASAGAGSVNNAGQITAAKGGYVVLAAPQVHNSGAIDTPLGQTVMAAGDHVTLQLQGASLLGYRIERGALQALVEQAGQISADGGTILIEARALDALASAVVNHSGISQARTVQEREGRIVLLGDLGVGQTHVHGTLDASAPEGGNGGFIETSAATVKVADSARIDTHSARGANGTWLIDPTDFTVAATGGDISGAALGTALASGNVVLDSTAGANEGAGDLYVRDQVNWSANRLTLRAQRDIHLYQDLVGSGSAQLTMAHGLSTVDGAGTDYHLHNGSRVYLPEGLNLNMQRGSAGPLLGFQVITQLHTASTPGGLSFYGINADGGGGRYALGGSLTGGEASYAHIRGTDDWFTGQFHGMGHQLKDFTQGSQHVVIDETGRDEFAGLFSRLGPSSVVRDFQLVGGYAYWYSSYSGFNNWRGFVGSVAGLNQGLIHNVYSSAQRRASSSIEVMGGLVGINEGVIRQSQFDGAGWASATPASASGQIAGVNRGRVEDVAATGDLSVRSGTSTFQLGAFGTNIGQVDRVHVLNSDAGSHVIDDNSVRTHTAGEMKLASTYAGWDIGTDPDGDSLWRIFEAESTPLLRDFRRRVALQTELIYNGQTQVDGGTSGLHAGFYAATVDMQPLGQEVTGGLTIKPAPLGVSSTDVNRVYDGTTDAPGAQLALTSGQLFGNDTLGGGSFAFADRHVGTGKTVTVSGVTVDDGQGGANYALALVDNTSSSITAAPLVIEVDPAHKVYDGNTHARTGWRVISGRLFGTDALHSLRLEYDSPDVAVNKSLLLSGTVLDDGNGGANYAPTLLDSAASSIEAGPQHGSGLFQAGTALNQAAAIVSLQREGARAAGGDGPWVVIDCGILLPPGAPQEDCR